MVGVSRLGICPVCNKFFSQHFGLARTYSAGGKKYLRCSCSHCQSDVCVMDSDLISEVMNSYPALRRCAQQLKDLIISEVGVHGTVDLPDRVDYLSQTEDYAGVSRDDIKILLGLAHEIIAQLSLGTIKFSEGLIKSRVIAY